jgi:hypothetical protein
MNSTTEYFESCKEHKYYKCGVYYQTYGKRYDLKNFCIVEVQEINYLESIEINPLNDTIYFAMGPGGQAGDCWELQSSLPTGADWDYDIPISCFQASNYITKKCSE